MHRVKGFAITAALAIAVCTVVAQDADRKVAGGGITAKGWMGKVDAAAAKQGKTINDSKLMQMGSDLHVAAGPAAVYWNPANTAKGNYTVKATFKEGKMTADHPHPYGLFIGGSKLDTDTPNLLYCVAYGTGEVLVRGFSEGKVMTVSKRAPNAAANKAAGEGRHAGDRVERQRGHGRVPGQRQGRGDPPEGGHRRSRQTRVHRRGLRPSRCPQRRRGRIGADEEVGSDPTLAQQLTGSGHPAAGPHPKSPAFSCNLRGPRVALRPSCDFPDCSTTCFETCDTAFAC